MSAGTDRHTSDTAETEAETGKAGSERRRRHAAIVAARRGCVVLSLTVWSCGVRQLRLPRLGVSSRREVVDSHPSVVRPFMLGRRMLRLLLLRLLLVRLTLLILLIELQRLLLPLVFHELLCFHHRDAEERRRRARG